MKKLFGRPKGLLLWALSAVLLASVAVKADTLTPALTAGGAVSGTDIVPCYQGAEPTKGCTATQLKTFYSASPTLVTPNLGTPSAGVLTNATGLPVSTGISGLGSGVATFLATPSSANLAGTVTGASGSGALLFGTSPSLTTPSIAGGALSGTFSGAPTFSGNPTFSGVPVFSGLSAGTQTKCLGLDVSNNVVINAAACGSGGAGSTTITMSPGLTSTPGTYNTGTQTITNGSTISLQQTPNPLAISASLAATDTAKVTWATASGLTFTVPNPGVTGSPSFSFGTDGTHSYTLATVSGIKTFYGSQSCNGGTTAVIPSNHTVSILDEGTNYQCSELSATGSPSGLANTPLFNNGSGGFTNGTRHGSTTEVATVTGVTTTGHVATFDASGNVQDGGSAPGGISCPTNFSSVGASCVWTNTPGATGCSDIAVNCIAFTGLTGNEYTLKCRNLLYGSGGNIGIQYGEGGTPTWETSSYAVNGVYQIGTGAPAANATGSTNSLIKFGEVDTSGTIGADFTMNLHGLASAVNHHAEGSVATHSVASGYSLLTTSGVYTGDTNAITAVRVSDSQATPAAIAGGSCSLYYHGT